MTSSQATKRLMFAASICALFASPAAGQSTKKVKAPCADSVTTKSGVYSAAQAARGKDVYAGNCRSCHTAETHTGPAFTSKWNKRPLSDLYVYIRDQMPKSAPGSLEPQEYADVLAYVLKMNRMPAGQTDLPADSAAINKIRIDVTRTSR